MLRPSELQQAQIINMGTQKKNLTVKELKAELDVKGIKYPAGGQLPQAEPEVPKGIFCKYCNRTHEKIFDNAGINHEKFDRGGKTENMFLSLCEQPKAMTFIPLLSGDIPNTNSAVQQFTLNGLRLNILKDRQIEVPHQIAELIAESQAATRKAYHVKTENLNIPGTYKDARTDLLNEAGRSALEV